MTTLYEAKYVTRALLQWPTAYAMGIPTAHCDTGMVLHYDGNLYDGRGLSHLPHSACVAYWISTRSMHMRAPRKWRDIGYSFGVCPHGVRFEGRGWQREQAAQPGGNTTWTSCTLMLGPGEMPRPEQIQGVRLLRNELMNKGLKAAIRPHSAFISTSCPGDIIRGMIDDGTFKKAPLSWDERLLQMLPTIKLGDNNWDVKSARGQLYQRGWKKTLSPEMLVTWLAKTEFDSEFRVDVMAFQRGKGLPDDGIIGRETWTKLWRG